MSGAAVAGTAAALAIAAVLLAGVARTLCGRESGWTSRWFLVPLAGVGGAGAAALASGAADLVGFAGLALGCVLLAGIDLACHRLPDRVLVPTGVVLVLGLLASSATQQTWSALGRAALGGAALGVGFLLMALISPRAIGLGDVKLAAVLGIFLGWFGWQALAAGLVATFVLGGLVALGLMAAGRATRTTALAFGPWLVLGAAVGPWIGQL